MNRPVDIILCADDFGISQGVNRAIIDLASKSRISAVTCMGAGAAWESGAPELRRHRDRIQAGLHLTLTYLPPLTQEMGARLPPEKKLFVQSWGRSIDKMAIEREMRAQFEKFITHWQAPPDFVDGHQHVHTLPVIRDIFLKLRQEYAPQSWVRNVLDLSALLESPKYGILSVMGFRLYMALRQHDIPHNTRMRGAYDYTAPADFAALMEKWCTAGQNIKSPLLVYCHPGFPDAELAQYDSVLEPRQREYDFLDSAAFGTWLDDKIRLVGRP